MARSDDYATPDHADRTIAVSRRTALIVLALAILTGAGLGRVLEHRPAVVSAQEPDATATRQAELDELERLRTRVAQTAVCSPAPTETAIASPTATPTPVPPVMMGQPVTYKGSWTVVVTGLALAPAPSMPPAGRYLQLSVVVTNNTAEAATLGFNDWVLVDETGRVFTMAETPTGELHGPSWYLGVDPSLETTFLILFDVAVDAGSSFILQSAADPTFRVAVEVQAFG